MPTKVLAPAAPVLAIAVTLLDAEGNVCDDFIAEPGEAAILAANFLLVQGSDPDATGADATGADATAGEIRFRPLRTLPARSDADVRRHQIAVDLAYTNVLAWTPPSPATQDQPPS
jgi:hypothetical protein